MQTRDVSLEVLMLEGEKLEDLCFCMPYGGGSIYELYIDPQSVRLH